MACQNCNLTGLNGAVFLSESAAEPFPPISGRMLHTPPNIGRRFQDRRHNRLHTRIHCRFLFILEQPTKSSSLNSHTMSPSESKQDSEQDGEAADNTAKQRCSGLGEIITITLHRPRLYTSSNNVLCRHNKQTKHLCSG